MRNLPEVLSEFALVNDCDIGVTDAAPLDTIPHSDVPFVSRDMRKRTNPTAILPGANSVIVVAVPLPQPAIYSEEKHSGKAHLSSLATTPDYHPRVKTLLQKLATERHIYKILVDSPTLDERAFAARAGIGFLGLHGLIISPLYGTRFNIGLLVTDIQVDKLQETTARPQPSCLSCQKCIAACPTNALSPGMPLNTNRCISYMTQAKNITPQQEALLAQAGQLYGCDICQNACPYNTTRTPTVVDPQEWITLSDADFAKKYGHTAMLWQGTELLRRNARLVHNYLDNPISNT